MRVAVTLEQCWHRVPGGSARATLDTVAALQRRGGLEQVGVSAWHRQPPQGAWKPTIDVRALPLPRRALYDAWQRLRHPIVERATGAVDLVHATAHVASASRAPMVATIHDLHFLYEPAHFTARGVSVFTRFLAIVRDEAAVVVCPSEATRADCVAAGINADRWPDTLRDRSVRINLRRKAKWELPNGRFRPREVRPEAARCIADQEKAEAAGL